MAKKSNNDSAKNLFGADVESGDKGATVAMGKDDRSKEYNVDIHERLLRRYGFKRELLILTVENFIIDNDERRVLRNVTCDDGSATTEKTSRDVCENGANKCTMSESDRQQRNLIRMLRLRRANREEKRQQQPREDAGYINEHIRQLSIEQLNETLHVLDNLYKDAIELIEFNENASLTIMNNSDDTVNLFIEILGVLLA